MSLALRLGLGVATLLGIGLLWQGAVEYGLIDPQFVSSPVEAGTALVAMARDGQLASDIVASAVRAILGFALGSVLGIAAGLSTGRYALLSASAGQVLRMLRGIPAISIIPFLLIWFGLGEASKILVVSWAVFFPVWINVHLGVEGVPIKFIWTAQSLGAKDRHMLTSIVFPAALPAVLAGMRTGIGLSYVALFGAEMAGALSGVGYRIYSSYTVYRVDIMVADLLVLGVLAAATDLAFVAIVGRVFPWVSGRRPRAAAAR